MQAPLSPQIPSWKNLYVAALYETDPMKVPELIARAEREIVVRARQLFNAKGDTLEEGEALDDTVDRRIMAAFKARNLERHKIRVARRKFRRPHFVIGTA